jgi:hypothetical protein
MPGLHRYEVAQGFQPTFTQVRGLDLRSVLEQAAAVMGAAPDYVWQSQTAEGWAGPPAVWASWD